MKALLLIDIQNGLTKKKRLFHENLFFNTINTAIKTFRDSDSKIIFVQHNNKPLQNGTPDWDIDSRIDKHDNDYAIQKRHGNAFQNSNLEDTLLELGIDSITVCGLVSHGCVKETCLGGLEAGFNTSLLKNGHTNWNRNAEILVSETEKDLENIGVTIYDLNPTSEKSLHDMPVNELGHLFPILIQDYSEKWIDLYQTEKKLITESFLPSDIVSIDHIGSTSIPGIKAKPTIDILLQINKEVDLTSIKNTFKSLGYSINEHSENPPPHFLFVKGYSTDGFKGQAYHVHIRYEGDWDEIRFRNYLVKHREVAKEYEALKLKLAEKFRNDREAYTNSKTDWIEKINAITRKQAL